MNLADPRDNPEDVKRAVRWLLRAAERARRDPVAFFEFVLRNEHTRQPIKIAPHQQLGIEFARTHDRAVLMWPIGHAKTFTLAGLGIFDAGVDDTIRGAIVSSTQGQAEKPLRMIESYVRGEFPEVRLVFPHLGPTLRSNEPWTQTSITVDRPAGIRDATWSAVGYRGDILGRRLNRIFIDDIVTAENVATKEQRDGVYRWVSQDVLGRVQGEPDPRVLCTNTARHPEDLPHRLRDLAKWPTLQMSAEGDIRIHNTEFDSELIRPATESIIDERVRLVAHDPDPRGETPLFPQRFTREMLARIKSTSLPEVWAQDWLQECRDDATALCRQEYIDKCKREFRKLLPFIPHIGTRPYGPNWFCTPETIYRPGVGAAIYTGIDLGIGQEKRHDESAWFTFERLPTGHRLILDVEIGRFDTDGIVQRSVDKWRRYGGIVRVETNGGQKFLKDFVHKHGGADMPVRAHVTGKDKWDPITGVATIFTEMMNGAWLIPCDQFGRVHPALERWAQACLNYRPQKHTGDVLMANWFAHSQARKVGHGAMPGGVSADPFDADGSLGMSIMSR